MAKVVVAGYMSDERDCPFYKYESRPDIGPNIAAVGCTLNANPSNECVATISPTITGIDVLHCPYLHVLVDY